MLDPNGEYSDLYNRYAHIFLDFIDGPTKITKANEDAISLKLSYSDLLKLPVEYVLSDHKLEEGFNNNNILYELLYSDNEGNYYIYKINNML